MVEVWKSIKGYEGLYEVSNKGNVRSLDRWSLHHDGVVRYLKGVVLKQNSNGDGYMTVTLCDGGRSTKNVHRLVAETFIANPNNLPQVNHMDEVRSNNCVENLEWCTNQYNAEYSRAKSYTFTNPEGEVIEVFNLRKFCRDNGLIRSSMASIQSGKQKQHKGWRLRP